MTNTPGPWKVYEDMPTIVLDSTGEPLADCSGQDGTVFKVKKLHAVRMANAKLISTAPELLEMLKRFLNYPHNQDLEQCYRDAEKAIKKAEGK